MTEEERFRATDRFEKELRRMDADRLKKSDWMKADWVAVLLLAMTAFVHFIFSFQAFKWIGTKKLKI